MFLRISDLAVSIILPYIVLHIVLLLAIPGVTAPVAGAAPVTTVGGAAQYTGTVTWEPAHATFTAGTAYTATITLTAKAGYTLNGVAANSFTVAGATVTHAVNSGVISAVFPAAAAGANDGQPVVTLTEDNGKFHVKWTAVTGASGYQVVWAVGVDTPEAASAVNKFDVTSGTTTSHTVMGATNGSDYDVWVRTKKADGTYSSYSEKKTVKPKESDAQPAKPTGITVSATDEGELKITWEAAQWATSYEVRIGTNADDRAGAQQVAPAAFNKLTYTTGTDGASIAAIANLGQGPTYYVWVTAINNNPNRSHSDPAIQVTITTPPASVEELVGTTWKSAAGATYEFKANQVVVYTSITTGTPADGEFTYTPATAYLTLNFTESATATANTTIKGKTFKVGTSIFTKQ